MAFEQFKHGGTLPKVFVRITGSCQLRIGAALTRQCCNEKPSGVSLYFDRESSRIAMHLLQEEERENTFSYTLNSSRADWHVHALIIGFVNHYKIQLPVTTENVTIESVNGKDMIVFTVKTEEVPDG